MGLSKDIISAIVKKEVQRQMDYIMDSSTWYLSEKQPSKILFYESNKRYNNSKAGISERI